MYAARAKDIQAHLTTAGDEVKDQEVAIQFLAGLPPAYGMISTVLTSMDKELKNDEMLAQAATGGTAQPEHSSEAALFAKPPRRLQERQRQHATAQVSNVHATTASRRDT